MELNKILIILILVIFFKTGNVLSEEDIFNVNNVKLIKKANNSYEELTNKAINKGFKELIDRILLDKDRDKLAKMNFQEVKKLVSYYQISGNDLDDKKKDEIYFNIFFDREKFHNLFFKRGISYSEIFNKEIYLLPVIIDQDQIFIYNQNYFYENWKKVYDLDLIDFILPVENIEVIRKININKDNLLSLNLDEIFQEYSKKDLAFVILDKTSSSIKKVYIRTKILGKEIDKNINVDSLNLENEKFNLELINIISKEIINSIKTQNLIDIRTPSFLNARLKIDSKNSLVELKKKLKKVKLIQNIYIQELNNKDVYLKIKYLGKLEKIVKKLENQKVFLKLAGDKWSLKLN